MFNGCLLQINTFDKAYHWTNEYSYPFLLCEVYNVQNSFLHICHKKTHAIGIEDIYNVFAKKSYRKQNWGLIYFFYLKKLTL